MPGNKKNVPRTGPKYFFCMLIRRSNEAKKKKINKPFLKKNLISRFLLYKAMSKIKGKIIE